MAPELPANLRALFPFPSHFVEIDGLRMHYIDEGRGGEGDSRPVVLLLHGNPTWSFYFRDLIQDLRSDFRVIAPDHLGCGLSDHPEDRHFRSADRARHLEQFVDALGLTKFSLVLHDWGGPIGTSLATRRLDSIERIVYLNTTLTEVDSLPGIIKRAHLPLVGKYLTKWTMHFLKLTVGFGVARRISEDVKAGYFFPYQTIARRTAIWDFVEDIPFESDHPSYPEMMAFAEKLPELEKRVPVAIIWGLRDPCFHREMLRKVASHFPKAHVVEIPDASHLVLEDKPQIVIPEIRRFLENRPAVELAEDASNPIENELYARFRAFAAENPQCDAIVVPDFDAGTPRYTHVSYRDLQIRVNQYERGLNELGLASGDRVLMLVPPGVDFLALSYAVMGRGAVPVFIDPGMGKDKLLTCVADASPDALIGTPRAQLLRLAKKRLFPRLKFGVSVSEYPFSPFTDLSFLKKFSAAPLPRSASRGVAMVAFTSGATGTPKGVIFTNEMIAEELEILTSTFGYKGGTKDLPLLPIFSLFNLALGVGSVFPPINPAQPLALDPARIVKIIQDLAVTTSFGSPTLWNKISEYCIRSSTTLETLRRVLMAGAPVPEQLLSRVQSILPEGEAATPYGATEALPVTFVRASEILNRSRVTAVGGEEGTFVGKPVSSVSIKIIEPHSRAIETLDAARELAPREIGEIIVSGRNVSRSYLSRPDANRSSKIREGERVWHRMGDLGYLDEEGNLYFCGRKVHSVALPGKVLYSVPVERLFNQHAAVRRSALVALQGFNRAGIVVEPLPQKFPHSAGEREHFVSELRKIAAQSPLTSDIQDFFFHPSFPVDSRHNAKIFRDKLSDWSTEQLASSTRASQTRS